MSLTPLDARVRFTVPVAMPDEIAELLRTIPGVSVWRRRPIVDAPHNAAFLVERLLHARRVPFTVKVANLPSIDAEMRIRQNATELHEGILDDFILPFQREVIYSRVGSDGGHVFSPAGSGKTLISIIWALSAPGPVLAVTKANARRQWSNEVKRFTDVEPFPLLPETDYRKRDQFRELDAYLGWCAEEGRRPFVVLGWEGLRQHLDALIALGARSVVFDESHKAKQEKRAKWRVTLDESGKEVFEEQRLGNTADLAQRLAEAVPRRLTTTATPVANTLADLWGQLKLAEPEAWGKTSSKFKVRYCNAVSGSFGGLEIQPPGHSNTRELNARISFTVSRVPYEILRSQLPPKRRVVTRVSISAQSKPTPMSREDRAEYKRAMKELGEAVRAGNATHWEKQRLSEQFRLDAADRKRKFLADRVSELLTMGKGKLLIFHGRKRACDALAKSIRGKVKGTQIWTAHGDVSAKEREQIKDDYMAHPGPCIVVSTYQAMGESLNLQDTDAILVPMLPITPAEIEQLEGRGARLGQSRPLLVEYFIAENTIDERLGSILLDKLPAVEQVTGSASDLGGLADAIKGIDDLEGLLDRLVDDLDMFGEES